MVLRIRYSYIQLICCIYRNIFRITRLPRGNLFVLQGYSLILDDRRYFPNKKQSTQRATMSLIAYLILLIYVRSSV